MYTFILVTLYVHVFIIILCYNRSSCPLPNCALTSTKRYNIPLSIQYHSPQYAAIQGAAIAFVNYYFIKLYIVKLILLIFKFHGIYPVIC